MGTRTHAAVPYLTSPTLQQPHLWESRSPQDIPIRLSSQTLISDAVRHIQPCANPIPRQYFGTRFTGLRRREDSIYVRTAVVYNGIEVCHEPLSSVFERAQDGPAIGSDGDAAIPGRRAAASRSGRFLAEKAQSPGAQGVLSMSPAKSQVSQRQHMKEDFLDRTLVLILSRCDLSRPCQTCRDRDHPELCSYHPPNKRQNVEQSTPAPRMRPVEDGHLSTPASGAAASVTLGRAEFDMLCRKLNGLENSIADLKREIRRNAHDSNGNNDSDGSADAPRQHFHTDVHGLHTKNESVSHRRSFDRRVS